MKIFFWQNTNSIHQSAFFRSLVLCNDLDATLIVTEKISNERFRMGWNLPELKGLKVVDLTENKLSSDKWRNLIDLNVDSNSWHIFSGINAFPIVHNAFVYAKGKNCKIGIFTEPLDVRGFKGLLRNLRGHYHSFIYKNKIDIVLVTGKSGFNQFRSWGYDKNKIFGWSYTVEKSKINEPIELKNSVFNIMFAGSLLHLKGYDILINALKIIKSKGLKFKADFYCLHSNELDKNEKLKLKYNLGEEINLLPFIDNAELRSRMNSYDLFVLPSRYDGWGAVINESLAEGTPVIVSSKCGSSTLISNSFTGNVIYNLNEIELSDLLEFHIKKGILSYKDRLQIKEWYNDCVSGNSMAKYLLEIIFFVNNEYFLPKPIAPWEK
jgi:glycosyltransferase involved in cell wall biosynthesis